MADCLVPFVHLAVPARQNNTKITCFVRLKMNQKCVFCEEQREISIFKLILLWHFYDVNTNIVSFLIH